MRSNYKLSIEYADSGPKLKIDGNEVSETEFKAALSRIKCIYSNAIQQDTDALKKYEVELTDILKKGQQIKDEIDGTSEDLNLHIENVDEVQKQTQGGLDELLAIRNNPSEWSQLKPEKQEQIEKEIARLRTDLAKADQVKKQAQTAVENGRKAVEKLNQNYSRGTAKLKGNGQFWDALSKMKLDLSKLNKAPKTEQKVLGTGELKESMLL